ncbi:unnamed protein product, partial [marine sediment metagenome]
MRASHAKRILLASFLFLPMARGSAPARTEGIPVRVQAAVRRGLEFLRRTQQSNGSWQDSYGRSPAIVGLVVLAHLAHGDMPGPTKTGQAIKRAVDY